MQVRLITEADAIQVIDLIYETVGQAAYVKGHAKLNPSRVGDIIVASLRNPYSQPCFIQEAEDGYLTGILYGVVENMLFGDEKWFFERLFYIRPAYRSYQRARAYMNGLREWCSQEAICRIEFGNGFSPNPRLSLLYRRMGFEIVNTTYAKRI